ncbi:MAG: CHAD domain-containing protein [Pseudomonadota bacterium]
MRHEYALPEDFAAADIADTLCQRFALRDLGAQRWVVCYFDTFDWRLFNQGYVLEEHRNGSSNHLHWRCLENGAPDRVLPNARMPHFAHELPVGAFRERLSGFTEPRALLPQVIVHTQAHTLNFENDDGKTLARLTFETGSLADADHTKAAPVVARRLRLQPLRGYEASCKALSREVKRLGLRLAEHDLMVEALAFSGRRPACYVVRPRVHLAPEARTDEAARQLLSAFFGVMQCNLPGVRARTDPEFLHDFRTSLRRARALLSELDGVFPKRTLERYRRDLKWLGEITGDARDLDVLVLSLDDYASLLEEEGEVREAFSTHCQSFVARELEQAYERLHERLASVRFERLVSSLKEFVASPAPRRTPLEHAMAPIDGYARARLRRRFRKLRKAAVGAGDGQDAQVLHDARIVAKRCRYLLDAFATLLPKDRVRALRRELKALQDQLGTHHDCYVHEQALITLSERMRLQDALTPAVASAIEQLRVGLQAKQRDLGVEAAASLRTFASKDMRVLCKALFAAP